MSQDLRSLLNEVSGDKAPLSNQPEYTSHLINPAKPKLEENQPTDEFERAALARFAAGTDASSHRRRAIPPSQ